MPGGVLGSPVASSMAGRLHRNTDRQLVADSGRIQGMPPERRAEEVTLFGELRHGGAICTQGTPKIAMDDGLLIAGNVTLVQADACRRQHVRHRRRQRLRHAARKHLVRQPRRGDQRRPCGLPAALPLCKLGISDGGACSSLALGWLGLPYGGDTGGCTPAATCASSPTHVCPARSRNAPGRVSRSTSPTRTTTRSPESSTCPSVFCARPGARAGPGGSPHTGSARRLLMRGRVGDPCVAASFAPGAPTGARPARRSGRRVECRWNGPDLRA